MDIKIIEVYLVFLSVWTMGQIISSFTVIQPFRLVPNTATRSKNRFFLVVLYARKKHTDR